MIVAWIRLVARVEEKSFSVESTGNEARRRNVKKEVQDSCYRRSQ